MRFFLAMAVLLTAGCAADSDLDGTWYFRSVETGEFVYLGEHIILQDGDRVVVRDCRGYVNEYMLDGENLFAADGSLYYLHVVDNKTLTGFGDLGGTSTAVKLFSRIRFEHGSLHFASPPIGALNADEDVCAVASSVPIPGVTGRVATKIVIAAPYGRTNVRVELIFRELVAGVHPLVEGGDFSADLGAGVLVSIESEEFSPPIGYGALPLVGGTVEVTDARPASFQFHGTLQLSSEEALSLSGHVDLTTQLTPGD
jgi:hypothetical protein